MSEPTETKVVVTEHLDELLPSIIHLTVSVGKHSIYTTTTKQQKQRDIERLTKSILNDQRDEKRVKK